MLYLNIYIIKKMNNTRKDSSTLKIKLADFPGGIVGKNSPANAGDRGWPPVWKIPHATEQLSLCARISEPLIWGPGATTTETGAPRAHALQQKKPLQWEACAPKRENRPCSLQLEKAHTKQRRPSTAKNK